MQADGGADAAGLPAPTRVAAAVEENRLRFYLSLLVTILMDAAFLAIWLAAIVAVHAEYEWAKKSVPAAATFMEGLEWLLLIVTALTLVAWVAWDAYRFLRRLWASR
jgi:hypothetical protein